MPPVFGRTDPAPHPYDRALAELLGSEYVAERAFARNLMHDHRVSEERAEAFDKLVPRPCRSASDLIDGVQLYFERRVRRRRLPDYVYTALNGDNFLTGMSSGEIRIHKKHPLARILDLSGLTTVYRWAQDRGYSAFERSPTSPATESQVAGWLDRRLGGARQEAFVASVLEVLNDYRVEQPFQPSWATLWDELAEHLGAGPTRWLELLGIHQPRAGRWLIVLKYPVGAVSKLVHPTVLDAGPTPYYFPSPPRARFGHPVDLGAPARGNGLLTEVIHRQIDHPLSHWTDAGSICERTEDPTPDTLAAQREAHLERLVRDYGSDVLGWMPAGG